MPCRTLLDIAVGLAAVGPGRVPGGGEGKRGGSIG